MYSINQSCMCSRRPYPQNTKVITIPDTTLPRSQQSNCHSSTRHKPDRKLPVQIGMKSGPIMALVSTLSNLFTLETHQETRQKQVVCNLTQKRAFFLSSIISCKLAIKAKTRIRDSTRKQQRAKRGEEKRGNDDAIAKTIEHYSYIIRLLGHVLGHHHNLRDESQLLPKLWSHFLVMQQHH